MTTTTTTQTAAEEAAKWFETAYRGEGDDAQRYTRLKDERPEWVYELVYAAHGNEFLPDDWRYDCIRAAVDAIAEGYDEPGEFADGQVDAYNAARIAWLGSNLNRAGYCDEALEEFGPSDQGIYGLIGMGQYMEASEVFGLVLQALEEHVDESEEV